MAWRSIADPNWRPLPLGVVPLLVAPRDCTRLESVLYDGDELPRWNQLGRQYLDAATVSLVQPSDDDSRCCRQPQPVELARLSCLRVGDVLRPAPVDHVASRRLRRRCTLRILSVCRRAGPRPPGRRLCSTTTAHTALCV